MTDDGSRGVHLTDKEVVFVVMAATVVAGVVFLFGVLVGRGAPAGRPPAAEASMITPAQVVSDGGADTAAADPAADGLSYPDRLGSSPPAETLKAPAAPVAAAPPVVDAGPPPVIAEEAGGASEAPASPGVTYTVQIAAEKKRSSADAIVKRLKASGFDAFVYVPEGGDTLGVFRVRVGAFATRREADAMAQRIARETRYKQPWVTH
jgi:cell division septation protein DedD